MSQIIDGYICKDGERVAFYDCDPSKNETCKKTSCGILGRGFGGSGCTATTNKTASREGAEPYYIKIDKSGPEVSFVRERIEEAKK